MRMLQNVRRAWYSSQALRNFARNDAEAALCSIEAMRDISPLSAAERMWTYYPLILANRFEDAFDILDQVCQETDNLDDENSRFINLCARATRASTNGDYPLHEKLLHQAGLLKPKVAVKMWSQFNK